MSKRKYKTDPNVLLEQGKLIISSSNESKFLVRVFAVNMVLAGCSTSVISELAGVSKVSVNDWAKMLMNSVLLL